MQQRMKVAVLVALGVLTGAVFLQPVAAHVGSDISHLWADHLKEKTTNLGDARYQRFGINSTLPPGKSLTGTVAGRVNTNTGTILDDISFEGKLSFTPTVVGVAMDDETPPEGCPGNVGNPVADPGYLCVYTGWAQDVQDLNWTNHWDIETGSNCGCRRGVVVFTDTTDEQAEISGVWTVRAPTS